MNAGVGFAGLGLTSDGFGDLDRIVTTFWEDNGRGLWLFCWDELGSAGMAVLLIDNNLRSSIAFLWEVGQGSLCGCTHLI